MQSNSKHVLFIYYISCVGKEPLLPLHNTSLQLILLFQGDTVLLDYYTVSVQHHQYEFAFLCGKCFCHSRNENHIPGMQTLQNINKEFLWAASSLCQTEGRGLKRIFFRLFVCLYSTLELYTAPRGKTAFSLSLTSVNNVNCHLWTVCFDSPSKILLFPPTPNTFQSYSRWLERVSDTSQIFLSGTTHTLLR